MRSLAVPAGTTVSGVRATMVWLPGANGAPGDFIDAGFAAAVERRRCPLDLSFVALEFEHLQDRQVLEHLHETIVRPLKARGAKVWLGGVSFGGLLALDYVACHRTDIDGICLLAPYLGNRILTSEIARAGSLAAWEPGELAETDEERRIWRYIKQRGAADAPLYLGFGEEDRFAAAHRLLASTLSAASVRTASGGHDWPTWSNLWEQFLDLRWI